MLQSLSLREETEGKLQVLIFKEVRVAIVAAIYRSLSPLFFKFRKIVITKSFSGLPKKVSGKS